MVHVLKIDITVAYILLLTIMISLSVVTVYAGKIVFCLIINIQVRMS